MAHDPLYREAGRRQTGRPRATLLLALATLFGLAFSGTILGYGFGVHPSSTHVTFGSMGSISAPIASVTNPQPEAVTNPQLEVAPQPEQTATVPSARSPESTVGLFYSLLNDRRYTELREIVTGPMYASLPDARSLNDRTAAGSLTLERADLTSLDQSGNTAVVTVAVVEQVALGAGESTQHYVGTWTLVRGPSGWLLSDSNLNVG